MHKSSSHAAFAKSLPEMLTSFRWGRWGPKKSRQRVLDAAVICPARLGLEKTRWLAPWPAAVAQGPRWGTHPADPPGGR